MSAHLRPSPSALSTVKPRASRAAARPAGGDRRVGAGRRFARRAWYLAAALLLAGVPRPAVAHGNLKSSEPAAGARLTTVPRTLRLTFTEAPALAFTRVELLDPAGVAVALTPLVVAPDSRRAVVTTISGSLRPGTYTVAWQMAGDDGHPMRGRFAFTIAPGAQAAVPAGPTAGEPGGDVAAPGQATPPASHHDVTSMPEGTTFGAESPLYVAVRWLLFVGLLVVLGAVAFQSVVLSFLRRKQTPDSPMLAPARDRAARVGLWATGVVAVAALLRLGAQSYAMHGPGQVLDAGLVGTMLTQTVWGWGWLLQALAVVVAGVGFRRAARGHAGGWAVAAVGAGALAFTPALSGHAASAPQLTPLAILADGLHVVGAGGWLGSLLLLVAVGIPAAMRLGEAERGPAVADLVNAFSPTALVFAGMAAATGVFAAWLHLGAVAALWQSAYGKTLLLKLAILSVVAATGAYNWLRVKPALGDLRGAVRIRRSGVVELAVGVLVLVVTAVLVATPTAMDIRAMDATPVSPPGAAASP